MGSEVADVAPPMVEVPMVEAEAVREMRELAAGGGIAVAFISRPGDPDDAHLGLNEAREGGFGGCRSALAIALGESLGQPLAGLLESLDGIEAYSEARA